MTLAARQGDIADTSAEVMARKALPPPGKPQLPAVRNPGSEMSVPSEMQIPQELMPAMPSAPAALPGPAGAMPGTATINMRQGMSPLMVALLAAGTGATGLGVGSLFGGDRKSNTAPAPADNTGDAYLANSAAGTMRNLEKASGPAPKRGSSAKKAAPAVPPNPQAQPAQAPMFAPQMSDSALRQYFMSGPYDMRGNNY